MKLGTQAKPISTNTTFSAGNFSPTYIVGELYQF
jgi:hypothetical protein